MEELSIEEKAKRYDEALAMAKECIIYIPDEAVNKYMLNMFPELKESEDDRIRKELTDYIKRKFENSCSPTPSKNILGNWITWLENQCKAKENEDSLNNQDKDERLRETTIAFLKEYVDKGYENAVECIDWLKKQDKQKSVWHDENEEPIRGSFILLIMQDGTPTVAKVIEPNQTIDQGERWAYIDDLLKK